MDDVRRVVALTADAEVRAAIVRLGALAGIAVEVVATSTAVRVVWRSADIVVVGADLAGSIAAVEPDRRAGVVVVATRPADDLLWRSTVQLGAAGLFVLPADERELVEVLSASIEPGGAGAIVAVVGGCGGAGATTFATALALLAGRDRTVGLIDGDRLGGGIDVLVGAEQSPGLRWPDLAETRGRISGSMLAERLIPVAECRLLSWDRSAHHPLPPDAAAAVIEAADRGFELVVVDLPRGFDPATELLASSADRLIVLTLATVRAVAAAAPMLTQLTDRGHTIDLVVRDPGGRGLSVAAVEGALGLPATATLQSESSVAVAAERGEVPRIRGSLARACQLVLETVDQAAAA